MAKNKNLSKTESKKTNQAKKNRDRIMAMYSILMGCHMGGGFREMGEEVRGLRSTNQ